MSKFPLLWGGLGRGFFVGRSSVLVHNEHGTGILGKMQAALRIQVTSLDALQEGLSARMLDYIEQFGGDKILTDLLNTQKFDELTDRLKRTAQSAVRKFEINELNVGSYGKMVKDFTKGVNELTAHHIPSDAYMEFNKISGYTHGNGLCIVVESSSIIGQIKATRHGRTKTFGNTSTSTKKTYYDMSPKGALKRDIDDLREIYIADGIYNANVEKALQDLIQKTKTTYSPLFD